MGKIKNLKVQENAKELRKSLTPAERFLWSKIKEKQLGYKFRKQHVIAKYIVDFICLEKNLIIELDGGQHNEETKEYDEKRDLILNKEGYKVIRFWNNDVLKNIEGVVLEIQKHLKAPLPANPSD
ncbi:MAG: endonuclease domain-containing protein [Elusimicrobiaceae bacterium]|jgi:very-short-patch-repair endonuclease|nr:endonuclease domain-containing protein [Elusimicrobiaceae bacterium]MBT3955108.1 endonuclease domain-containing protein [Elusimicrobiaceae bacterium]MBT4008015.1 endonuclease domain-containing protein [Elusimicrobiaceae bacterium]MBT4402862.1 endonuclease domain-containing protein [Elusimicrobiaceae bacterium]MBT5987859.1 endonuclease domain-containing protein [Elusimicrobiaceae bacterium]